MPVPPWQWYTLHAFFLLIVIACIQGMPSLLLVSINHLIFGSQYNRDFWSATARSSQTGVSWKKYCSDWKDCRCWPMRPPFFFKLLMKASRFSFPGRLEPWCTFYWKLGFCYTYESFNYLRLCVTKMLHHQFR